MHTKFGLNQKDFEEMVDAEQFVELAQKVKETYEKGKIQKGDYESALDWVRKSAKAKGKTINI